MNFDFQGALLDIIQHVQCNSLDGAQIRRDLDTNRNLWVACMLTRIDIGTILRSLEFGDYNVDSLYVLCAQGREEELERLAETWNAQHISWIKDADARAMLHRYDKDTPNILEVWWD